MNKKLLFIYNPTAGRGLIKQSLFDIIEIFASNGYEVVAHPTLERLDAFSAAEAATESLIVCSGGDGTLNETISGIISSGNNIPLGYIPAGTMNDFANCRKIPLNMTAAAELICGGCPVKTDIGAFTAAAEPEKIAYFNYVAAFGMFTEVSYDTPSRMKNTFGVFAYLMRGLASLPNIKPIEVTIEHDGECVSGEFLFGMAANSTSVGGIKGLTGNDVELDDGLFECVFVRAIPSSEIGQLASAIAEGEFKNKMFYTFKASELRISSESPLLWTLDGERGGDHSDVKISCLHRALTIIAGAG
ncbi:MAG: YegS/Rv2252/BmrU family lipid kinase [Ruminococcus sp.]|jgi:YegS/Rv2252/BmrU family lipid kinase|nr:YegS/Rv2252/BmrU family lipid kinase [Ruminococcus sp.]